MQGAPPLATLRRITRSQTCSLKPVILLSPIQLDALQWPKNTKRSSTTTLSARFLGHPVPTWSRASVSSNINSMPMVHLPATKRAGWSGASHSITALTTTRPSVRWLSQPRSVSSSTSRFLRRPSIVSFIDPVAPNHVCLLQKSLYGLKQAPRAWYQRFTSPQTPPSSCTRKGDDLAYLLLYVDDIILTASSSALLQHVTALLHSKFAMTDLGALHHFLGISVTRSSDGLFLSQRQYAARPSVTLRRLHLTLKPIYLLLMVLPSLTPRSTSYWCSPVPHSDSSGSCICRTTSLFVHAQPVRAISCSNQARPALCEGHPLDRSSSWQVLSAALTAYSEADWAGCLDSRRSTSGYCVFLGDNLASWSSKHHTTELHVSIATMTIVYCDNVSAVYMTGNPFHHRRTKHHSLRT
ncbi:LOW QUALITY PROTEIN: hypothetical protein U9M48_043295 [Paspalum notatum var. saurae]|uniref:Reverse transcriptase Ty1/copia-type domain-containing protein n=1 Tax=Paspalum notatum var. saurae TaxID=547442 RepID=A0AAQ3XGD8_PASNO